MAEVEREYARTSQADAAAPVLAEVANAVARAVARHHALQLQDVLLLRVVTIPKTSSGKIRRGTCLAGYLNSSLEGVLHRMRGEPAASLFEA